MKFSATCIFAFLIWMGTGTADAQNEQYFTYKLENKIVRLYEKAEWDIDIPASFTNPFDQQDIALDLVLTAPNGQPLTLPCFYASSNGGVAYWKARFAPQQTGIYHYHFVMNGKLTKGRSVDSKFNVLPSAKPGFLHGNNKWTFKFDNGQLFRGVGENIGWESRSFENDKWTYDYLLPVLAKNGGNFFRTWMCYWNLPLEWQKVRSTKRYQSTDLYFNPGAIKRMDQLVNMTDSLHLYFMLTMDWHGHLIDDGGWKDSPYNAVNGGRCKTPTDFFTNANAKARYKNKLRYIVARWGYSPSIGAFEFFNEIDNAAFTQKDSIRIPHDVITTWHAEMSHYLKSIDPYGHLVTTSISHRDIAGLDAVPDIDFNQKHIYKHTEKIPGIYQPYIDQFKKPYVVGEFGFRWEDADPKYAADADFDYKRGLWYGLFSPCPILPMTWWWEFFDEQKMTPYIRSVREISDQMLRAGNGSFLQIKISAGELEAYGLKCGKTTFVYLLNNTDKKVATSAALPPQPLTKTFSATAFTPGTRVYKKLIAVTHKPQALNINGITLEPRQEVVLIVK